MTNIVTGKSTPNETGNDLFVIHKGIKVIITDQLNNWIEIKLPNGEKGWVQYTDLEKI
jgi:SH3-like domain-containing protein